jgi:hypothetical protein
MTDTQNEEITPDQLLETFRGSSMKSIILFTVAVHVVVLIGTSVPYLWKSVAGGDSSKLSEKERMEIAAREATSSLHEIASKHGVRPEDLSSNFAGKTSATPPKEIAKPESPGNTEADNAPEAGDAPKSVIEKELDVKEAGPKLPAIEEEKEDLFK